MTPGKPLVQVVIPYSTLTGADDQPAELVGVGPIPATHHHRLKTHAKGWHVHAHPDGRLTWTTPTGHQHTTTPHDYWPDRDPPPF